MQLPALADPYTRQHFLSMPRFSYDKCRCRPYFTAGTLATLARRVLTRPTCYGDALPYSVFSACRVISCRLILRLVCLWLGSGALLGWLLGGVAGGWLFLFWRVGWGLGRVFAAVAGAWRVGWPGCLVVGWFGRWLAGGFLWWLVGRPLAGLDLSAIALRECRLRLHLFSP